MLMIQNPRQQQISEKFKLMQVKYFTKKHGVDGEISALCILLPVSGKLHLCVPPIGLYIHSQSGHFKVLIMKLYKVLIRIFQFAFVMLILCGKHQSKQII